jgi:DNA polymerase-1
MSMPNYVAVDTETTGLNPWRGDRMFAASATFAGGQRLYERDFFPHIKAVCEDPTIDKVFHNYAFDRKMLRREGIEVRGKVWDTMIHGMLIDGRDAGKGLSLDNMSKKYVPGEVKKVVGEIDDWFKENGYKHKAERDFSKLPDDLLRRRAIGDTDLTAALFKRMHPTVSKLFPFLLEQEGKVANVVDKAVERGMLVDLPESHVQAEAFTKIVDDVYDFFVYHTGNEYFNFHSDADIQDALDRAGLMASLIEMAGHDKKRWTGAKKYDRPWEHQPECRPKFDDLNLRRIAHPVPHMLLVGKAAAKMRDTFLGQIQRLSTDSVLHCGLNPLGTATGRFSCSGPNLQNVPIEGDRRTAYTQEESAMSLSMTGHVYAPHIKRNFLVRPGYAHIHSDKIQAEMVALAHYTRSQKMIDIFDQGISIHEGLCWVLYDQYTKGLKTRTKAVVFGFCYGAGNVTLAAKIGGSLQDARQTRARLEQALPDLPRWKEQLEADIFNRGYVETMHGRRHYLDQSHRYKAVNRMCQGTVGDEIKSCMVRINEMLESDGHDARILLNVHDDVITEVAKDEVPVVAPKILEIMNTSDLEWAAKPRADANITYSSWSELMEIKNIDDPSSYTEAAFNEHFGRH